MAAEKKPPKGLPPYSTYRDYDLSISSGWKVKFGKEGLNSLTNNNSDSKEKIFPATDITFMGAKPLIYENTICGEVPIFAYYGYQPPTAVTITFVDDDNMTTSKAINEWIKTGNMGGTDRLTRRGLSVTTGGITLTIIKYNQKGVPVLEYQFKALCPKDEVQYQFSSSSDPMLVQVQFQIIGIV